MTNHTENASGGGVAAPTSTEGVQMPTQPNQEIIVTHSNPVNVAAVEVITRVDMETINESFATRDLSLIRMSNGDQPTAEEMDLIKVSGPQDFYAAAEFMERHAELDMERHRTRMQLVEMVVAHSIHPKETTETIVARMSPEDQETFFDLMEAFL